jgi:putative flippase GtrA
VQVVEDFVLVATDNRLEGLPIAVGHITGQQLAVTVPFANSNFFLFDREFTQHRAHGFFRFLMISIK